MYGLVAKHLFMYKKCFLKLNIHILAAIFSPSFAGQKYATVEDQDQEDDDCFLCWRDQM